MTFQHAIYVRSALRNRGPATSRYYGVGARVVRRDDCGPSARARQNLQTRMHRQFMRYVTSICIAVVPDLEIRHGTNVSGPGPQLTGATAVVVGIGVVLWGVTFLICVWTPNSPL
ncbi:MAG: hypothetical protein WKF77_32005 [Planctomycetaceae bacterium]